ncbi:hypothetical protein OROGR_024451 [Orobanche gracilis]
MKTEVRKVRIKIHGFIWVSILRHSICIHRYQPCHSCNVSQYVTYGSRTGYKTCSMGLCWRAISNCQ